MAESGDWEAEVWPWSEQTFVYSVNRDRTHNKAECDVSSQKEENKLFWIKTRPNSSC